MKNQSIKSLGDLASIRDLLTKSVETPPSTPQKTSSVAASKNYHHLSETDRAKWAAVIDLLEDKFYSDLVSGLGSKISSKKYSTVTAVLTYPKKADALISQNDLDRAHGIAYFIKRGVNSGSIKYTSARIPSTWRVAGNPGTKR